MDQNNKPRVRLARRIGQSGTQIFNGYISNEDYNAALTGLAGIRKYEMMRRSDPTVRSTLQVVKLPILQAEWDVEPVSDDEADVFKAQFVKRELMRRKVNWQKFLREALTELDFGHSVIEKTFELTEYEGKKLVGIEELGYRKQTTILNWEADGKDGITQQLIDKPNVAIPREKLMYFVFDQEGDNYQGISLLRYVYKAWDFKHKYELLNGVATERHAAGVPVVEMDLDASQEELDAIDEIMRNFRVNEQGYIRKPKNVGVELLDMNSNSLKDVMPSMKYYDYQIQSSVLAQFLALGMTDTGSRATSQDHSKLYLMSEGALAKQLKNVIENELINQLCDLNFSDMSSGYPKLTFGKIGDENVEQLGQYVQNLFNSGAVQYDPSIENYLRKVGGLPEIPEDMLADMREQHKKRVKEGEPYDQKSKKPDPQVDEKNQKDIQAARTLKEAREIRERLIGALPGA